MEKIKVPTIDLSRGKGRKIRKERALQAIRPYLERGLTVTKACMLIGLKYDTFYTWLKTDEDTKMMVEAWKNVVNLKAMDNIGDAIHSGDVDNSKWWLERRVEDFNPKQTHEHKVQKLIVNDEVEAIEVPKYQVTDGDRKDKEERDAKLQSEATGGASSGKES